MERKSYTEVFDLTTTDVLFYDRILNGKEMYERDVKLTCEIIEMTPDEYLNECCAINNCTLEEVYQMISERNVQELIKVSKNQKLPLPFLNRVTNSQEGRHRAIVTKRLGLDTMPVMIIKST